MSHRTRTTSTTRNISLQNVDLTPPSGARARKLALDAGPMDETGLEQLAQYAEHEPTWTLGKVTAERLRMLAEKLRAENEHDHDARLNDLEAHLTAVVEKPGNCSITPVGARDYLAAIKALRSSDHVSTSGWRREREQSLKLEQLVQKLYDKVESLGASALDVTLVKGAPQGDDFSVDLYSDLALELAALDGQHKR